MGTLTDRDTQDDTVTEGSIIVPYYGTVPDSDVHDAVLETAADVGFDVEDATDVGLSSTGGRAESLRIPYDDWSVSVQFDLDDDRAPNEPPVHLDGLTNEIYPPNVHDEEGYPGWMDVVFELLCRLAVALEADYAPLCDTQDRAADVVPDDRPIGTAIDAPPHVGVFSRQVLDDLGGLGSLYDDPWYTATLAGDRTVVVESAQPWSAGGWEPPTDADFVADAQLRVVSETGTDARATRYSDPFSALEPGEYGADVCVHPDDIEAAFGNETLELVRVRVAEDGTLRRVEDDSVVRRTVEGTTTDAGAVLRAMVSDLPPAPEQSEPLASVLLHEVLPPFFVELESPEDENVVTRVMALEADVNKYDLLVRLGGAANDPSFDRADMRAMEQTLDELLDLAARGDVDDVERAIEERLF